MKILQKELIIISIPDCDLCTKRSDKKKKWFIGGDERT
jgi:hypothetical protein